MDFDITCPLKHDFVNSDTSGSYFNESINTDNRRVILNVGGFKHEIMWRTLNNIPNSRLGKLQTACDNSELLNTLCDGFNLKKVEFFFDRDPTMFNLILNYSQVKILNIKIVFCLSNSSSINNFIVLC